MFTENTKFLVVDDMTAVRLQVVGLLAELNYKNVIVAENGSSAIEVLSAQINVQDPVQVILSDWNMPHMTGIELLKNVRADAETKDLPFILITAEGEKNQIVEAIKLGVSEYLCKPLTPKEFKNKLEKAYKKHNK